MISAIISVILFLYYGYLALIWIVMFIFIIIGLFSSNKEGLGELIGMFLYFNGSIVFGLALGILIFGNLLNLMTEGQFAIQIFDPNKIGLILLISSVTSYIVGKVLMNRQKENHENLIEITEKEEIKIKDMVGGWCNWDRMDNKTKNKYIREYRKTGTVAF